MPNVPPNKRTQGLEPRLRIADYATAFDFLGKLAGCRTEEAVIEKAFDLFSLLFSPTKLIFLEIRAECPGTVISRSDAPFDLEEAKIRMEWMETDYAWTPSGKGFFIRVGEGPNRAVIQVEGVRFTEYLNHYLNLALNIVPVLSLALNNAKNYQLLQNEQYKLREAISAREGILAIVGHDLRNPLTAIELSARALEGNGVSTQSADRRRQYAGSILNAARRMNRLIEDLLDVGKIKAGGLSIEPEKCVVSAILSDVLREIRPVAEKKGVRLEEKAHPDFSVNCDRHRIAQVMLNILGNAVKFAPEQGGVITVACTEHGDFLLLSISDNGPGIQPEELPHVFDAYWQGRQRKKGGVGLGMAIAQGIIQTHGGRIWVESAPGKGASFFFTIPRASVEKVPPS
jgi:signal transduction histidine kinase